MDYFPMDILRLIAQEIKDDQLSLYYLSRANWAFKRVIGKVSINKKKLCYDPLVPNWPRNLNQGLYKDVLKYMELKDLPKCRILELEQSGQPSDDLGSSCCVEERWAYVGRYHITRAFKISNSGVVDSKNIDSRINSPKNRDANRTYLKDPVSPNLIWFLKYRHPSEIKVLFLNTLIDHGPYGLTPKYNPLVFFCHNDRSKLTLALLENKSFSLLVITFSSFDLLGFFGQESGQKELGKITKKRAYNNIAKIVIDGRGIKWPSFRKALMCKIMTTNFLDFLYEDYKNEEGLYEAPIHYSSLFIYKPNEPKSLHFVSINWFLTHGFKVVLDMGKLNSLAKLGNSLCTMQAKNNTLLTTKICGQIAF